MGFDYLDVIYSSTLPDDLPLEVVVESISGLLESGKARHWAIVNWPGEMLERAGELCEANGVPQPCAAQLPHNLVRRDWVESEPMRRALLRTGASVVASSVMAGGALTGKYSQGGTGRLSGQSGQRVRSAVEGPVRELVALAREWGTTTAALAIAFALSAGSVASVLFGATTPDQVRENAEAIPLFHQLDDERRERLRGIGVR